LGHVCWVEYRCSTRIADALGNRLALLPASCHEEKTGAFTRKSVGCGFPNSRTGTRYEDDLVLESGHGISGKG